VRRNGGGGTYSTYVADYIGSENTIELSFNPDCNIEAGRRLCIQTHPYSYQMELALPAPVVLPFTLGSSVGFSSTVGVAGLLVE
jgi:hypothetical protein